MLTGFSNPFSLAIFVVSLLFALTIHEAAHAWAANHLGDPTAKFAGRLTLNPLAHLDPIGTILLFLFGFGWGKPVPIDEFNLDNPRRDGALISLAGPGANLIAAIFFSSLWWLFYQLGNSGLIINSLMSGLIQLNVVLGLFNLLPVYPLDGSKILVGFLPEEIAQKIDNTLKQYGILVLIFLFLPIFFGQSLIDLLLVPAVKSIIDLLLFWG
jgi:Zn-dependent protease